MNSEVHRSKAGVLPQSPQSLSSTSDPICLSLPSPLHPRLPLLHPRRSIDFLYTGALVFSHRTYLSTALALLLSASYLALPTLYAEVSACIITEMAHGLFHAASTSNVLR
ncbi:hypothetical protein R3P38DRAFT_3492995 [Favolaschia claudopus]|uniref:Uncharacterized protein n=1 Tax=Favolaschia claudopus TaxID=2862362 RepID=A0AAW0C847_9AGAR